tara:strand:+ start:350 stop:706 length:357 start_codon:yes stop_codon:yes gene_type:complete
MKKLFVLIFTLTLSTSAFSWGNMSCDVFLDGRKSNDKALSDTLALSNKAAFDFFVFGHMEVLPNARELLIPLVMDPPVNNNQMLYLIDKECRNTPTQSVFVSALSVYRKIVSDALKEK